MSDKKKQQEKQLKLTIKTVIEVLSGDSSYRNESVKLKRLGMETGPDLEDALSALKDALETCGASPEALLSQLPGQPLPVFGAVVETLTQRILADDLPLELLQKAQKTTADRDAHRLLGAAFHRLQLAGKGVVSQPLPLSTAPATPPLPEAWISPPGFEERTILFVFVPEPTRDMISQIALKELQGFDEAVFETTAPRKTRRQLIDLSQHHNQLEPIAIPLEHLLHLLETMIEESRPHHIQVPYAITHLVQDLRQVHHIVPAPYVPADASAREPRYYLSPDEFGQLLQLAEVKTWSIPRDYLEKTLERIAERFQSNLVLAPELEKQLLNSEQDAMLNAFYTPARREIQARRLEVTAMRCQLRGDLSPIPLLFGSAQAIRDLSKSPSDVSFLRHFFELNLAVFLQTLRPALEKELGGSVPGALDGNPFSQDLAVDAGSSSLLVSPSGHAPASGNAGNDGPRIIMPY